MNDSAPQPTARAGTKPSVTPSPDSTDDVVEDSSPIPSPTATPATGVAPRSAPDTTSPATIVLTRVEVYFQVYPGKTTVNGTSIGISGQPYTIELADGTLTTGSTDSDGKVDVTFPPGSTAKLTIFGTEYMVSSRTALEPVAQLAGAQRRLQMLGYELGAGGVDGSNGQFTEKAVHAFQCDADIKIFGVLRRETRDTLVSSTWIGE